MTPTNSNMVPRLNLTLELELLWISPAGHRSSGGECGVGVGGVGGGCVECHVLAHYCDHLYFHPVQVHR